MRLNRSSLRVGTNRFDNDIVFIRYMPQITYVGISIVKNFTKSILKRIESGNFLKSYVGTMYDSFPRHFFFFLVFFLSITCEFITKVFSYLN